MHDSLFPLVDDAISSYIEAGQHDVALPAYEPDQETQGYAHASAVGICPLRAALRRWKIAPFVPPTERAGRDQAMKMACGSVVGNLVQKALVWYGGQVGVDIAAEVKSVNTDLRVSGRADIDIVFYGGERWVVEIKTSAYTAPRWSHVVQTLLYKITMHAERAYILLLNPFLANEGKGRPPFSAWRILESGDGYVVVNEETGELWSERQNSPEFINENTIRSAVDLHQQYLAAFAPSVCASVSRETLPIPAPFTLNDIEAEECMTVVDAPKRYERAYTYHSGQPDEKKYAAGEVRPGTAKTYCEYFCHGPAENGVFRVNLDGERLVFEFEG